MPTVLVVEDETLVCLSICEDLASAGYEVLTAANADEAIEILESATISGRSSPMSKCPAQWTG